MVSIFISLYNNDTEHIFMLDSLDIIFFQMLAQILRLFFYWVDSLSYIDLEVFAKYLLDTNLLIVMCIQ